jgi:predicted RNase H-like HicB family nuclease
MAESNQPARGHADEPGLGPDIDPLIPAEIRDAEGVRIMSVSTRGESLAAVFFSLDFPATLTAVVQAEESGGFSAEVPALPGCITEGETLEELRANLREAVAGWQGAQFDLAAGGMTAEMMKRTGGP